MGSTRRSSSSKGRSTSGRSRSTSGRQKASSRRSADSGGGSGRVALPGVYPVLAAHGWRGRKACVARPLVEKDGVEVPWLTFASVADGKLDYLLRKKAESVGLSDRRVERHALRELVAREGSPSWKVKKVAFPEGASKVLMRAGDELTASDILRPKLLQKAQAYLKAKRIVVGVPTRTHMFAASDKYAASFADFIAQRYNDGDRKVSPLVLIVQDGEIKDVFVPKPVAKPVAKPAAPVADLTVPADSDDGVVEVSWNRPTPEVVKLGGRGTLLVNMHTKGVDQAEEAVSFEFEELAGKISRFKGFEGHVVFAFTSDAVKPTMINRRRLTELARALTQRAKKLGLTGRKGEAVRVTCRIEEDD